MGKVKDKNNRKVPKFRMLEGKKVVPVQYHGKATGRGAFMAGSVEGKLVVDQNDKPLLFRQIGELV